MFYLLEIHIVAHIVVDAFAGLLGGGIYSYAARILLLLLLLVVGVETSLTSLVAHLLLNLTACAAQSINIGISKSRSNATPMPMTIAPRAEGAKTISITRIMVVSGLRCTNPTMESIIAEKIFISISICLNTPQNYKKIAICINYLCGVWIKSIKFGAK